MPQFSIRLKETDGPTHIINIIDATKDLAVAQARRLLFRRLGVERTKLVKNKETHYETQV